MTASRVRCSAIWKQPSVITRWCPNAYAVTTLKPRAQPGKAILTRPDTLLASTTALPGKLKAAVTPPKPKRKPATPRSNRKVVVKKPARRLAKKAVAKKPAQTPRKPAAKKAVTSTRQPAVKPAATSRRVPAKSPAALQPSPEPKRSRRVATVLPSILSTRRTGFVL